MPESVEAERRLRACLEQADRDGARATAVLTPVLAPPSPRQLARGSSSQARTRRQSGSQPWGGQLAIMDPNNGKLVIVDGPDGAGTPGAAVRSTATDDDDDELLITPAPAGSLPGARPSAQTPQSPAAAGLPGAGGGVQDLDPPTIRPASPKYDESTFFYTDSFAPDPFAGSWEPAQGQPTPGQAQASLPDKAPPSDASPRGGAGAGASPLENDDRRTPGAHGARPAAEPGTTSPATPAQGRRGSLDKGGPRPAGVSPAPHLLPSRLGTARSPAPTPQQQQQQAPAVRPPGQARTALPPTGDAREGLARDTGAPSGAESRPAAGPTTPFSLPSMVSAPASNPGQHRTPPSQKGFKRALPGKGQQLTLLSVEVHAASR